MKVVYYILIVTILAVASGCTRNNGDIGDYFGEWRLVSMTADGKDVTLYGENAEDKSLDFGAPEIYTLAFQGNVARINVIYAHHEVESIFGSWIEKGDELELNFSHHDDQNSVYGYQAPPVFRFPSDGIAIMKIVKMSGSDLKMMQISDEGEECCYQFVKQY